MLTELHPLSDLDASTYTRIVILNIVDKVKYRLMRNKTLTVVVIRHQRR